MHNVIIYQLYVLLLSIQVHYLFPNHLNTTSSESCWFNRKKVMHFEVITITVISKETVGTDVSISNLK